MLRRKSKQDISNYNAVSVSEMERLRSENKAYKMKFAEQRSKVQSLGEEIRSIERDLTFARSGDLVGSLEPLSQERAQMQNLLNNWVRSMDEFSIELGQVPDFDSASNIVTEGQSKNVTVIRHLGIHKCHD